MQVLRTVQKREPEQKPQHDELKAVALTAHKDQSEGDVRVAMADKSRIENEPEEYSKVQLLVVKQAEPAAASRV